MTIKEMRNIMREKVVPEEVVPQNVINCLIDEDAEPPKPDAFAFLMRLRALGIGSADFLNLLEGCGAPENVVNKIKQNPAMNLQGLILTLENSELTSDDYTRMLLTARQVWERTLTLRLEKAEKISQDIDRETDEDEAEEKPTDNLPEAQNVPEQEDVTDSEDDDPDYDEDMREMSFTAVLDKINSEIREGVLTVEETADEPDHTDITAEEAEHEQFSDTNNSTDESAENDNENTELSFAEAFDKIKTEKKNHIAAAELTADINNQTESTSDLDLDEGATLGDTTAIIRIDEEMLRENFGKLAKNSEETEEEMVSSAAPEKHTKTARQIKSNKTDDEPQGPEDEDETNAENESGKDTHRVYHKNAIIGAAAGAAVLVGAGFVIGNYFGGNNAKTLHYAADTSEIFKKIDYAYNASEPGGKAACGIEEDHRTIFGDLLISGDNDEKNLGCFSIGTGLYSITEEAISANIVENGTVTPLEELIPPENSHFVAAFDDNGELYALFSGKQSGFMKIADGKAEYTVRQDGILMDYDLSNGEMKLGTVYTPVFGHTFTINDEDVYLPKIGTDEPKPISPQKVIVSGTNGYSYGVSAGYSTENGSVNDVCAVIGDPVAASADGCFALNGDKGLLVKTNGKKFTTEQTEKLSRAAFGKNGCAIAEENAPENVKLLDKDFKTAAILAGIPKELGGIWFDGNVLTINDTTGNVFGVDCSDVNKPEPISLKSVNGIVTGQSALTREVNGNAVVITRYDLENGAAKKVGEYSKELTAEQLETVKLGDPKTAVVDGSKSGVTYSRFDGVSVVSEYVVFADGAQPKIVSVFDDKTGFTAAFKNGNAVYAVCAEGIKVLQ